MSPTTYPKSVSYTHLDVYKRQIPYLFILWACLKLGTAYRLAPGADFAHKLMGLGQSIGPAFAD